MKKIKELSETTNKQKMVFPVTIGKEGIDDFWLKQDNGVIHTWEERDIIHQLIVKGRLTSENFCEWDISQNLSS